MSRIFRPTTILDDLRFLHLWRLSHAFMAIPMPCIISPASAPTWWNHAVRIPERNVVNETSCIYGNKHGIVYGISGSGISPYICIYLAYCKCKHNVLLKMNKYNHIRQLVCVVKEYNYILRIGIDSLGHDGRPNLWTLCKCYSHRANADNTRFYTLYIPNFQWLWLFFAYFYGFSALHILWQRIHMDPDA